MNLTLEKDNKVIKYLIAQSLLELIKDLNYISYFNRTVNATLHCFDQKFSCSDLKHLKNLLNELNIKLICIVSNEREALISAKSLKINGIYSKNSLNFFNPKIAKSNTIKDLTHIGMVRSGDQISSNGNLIIIGDVNPGAKISAKKNIYVWGKLCGVAYAGKNGSNESTISSLYLNALQLRINKIVAIGPKEKPNSNYPEIALLEKGKIIIKPFLINNLK